MKQPAQNLREEAAARKRARYLVGVLGNLEATPVVRSEARAAIRKARRQLLAILRDKEHDSAIELYARTRAVTEELNASLDDETRAPLTR